MADLKATDSKAESVESFNRYESSLVNDLPGLSSEVFPPVNSFFVCSIQQFSETSSV